MFSLTGLAHAFLSGLQQYADYTKSAFTHPSLTNPLCVLPLVYVLTFSLELLLPHRLNYSPVKRKGFLTDLLYLLLMDYVIMLAGFFAMTCAIEYSFKSLLALAGITLPLLHLDTLLSGPARFLVFFLCIDFLQWLGHYLLHRIEFLWQFHKIHHAQETLGFASTRHFHWGEYLVLKPAFWIPFGVMGFEPREYVLGYVWIAYTLSFLSHCNLRFNWGLMNYLVITPQSHYWHHARNIPGKFGVNYASVLPVWDILFGSFYLPAAEEKPVLGIPGNDVPDSFLGQMAYPFQHILHPKPEPAQNADQDLKAGLSRSEKKEEKRQKKGR